MIKTIVHLAAYYPPHIGGVEKHLSLLNKKLVERDYKISVITQLHHSGLPAEEVVDKVKVYRISHPDHENNTLINKTRYKLSIWSGIFKLLPKLRSADIIQVHDVFFWLMPFLIALPRKKLFMTFHGYEGSDLPGRKQVVWHQLANLLTNKNLCIGKFHQKWYGVRPDEISFGAVEPPPPQKRNKQIAYIGRLHQDTGIMEYLKALQLLAKEGKNYKLDIFGDGPLFNRAQAYVRRHQLKVKFYGFVDNASRLLGKYDTAFVSRYLAILEALAADTKVIAHFNNEIKRDYLTISPFASWIKTAQTPKDIAALTKLGSRPHASATKWSKRQTWDKLANTYERMWSDK